MAVRRETGAELITKGAVDSAVLAVCTHAPDGTRLTPDVREALGGRRDHWGSQGIRVLGVAGRPLNAGEPITRATERGLTFYGFLTFSDRPKPGVAESIAGLAHLGVELKLITGDSGAVARHVAATVGMKTGKLLSGAELDDLHDDALWKAAEQTDLFVEVDPNQKERIIRALQRTGNVVGFLGDGVNDAPAMHAADTAISVDQAADVAKEASDFVLLERDLEVIRQGIAEGRRTFANTLKYILTTTSANLGNMISMAVASLFLPFLPLLAGQVLLNNFLSDVPAIGLADDSVDPEMVAKPRRWDMGFIGRFMVEFGVLSSMFDFFTFAVLLYVYRTPAETFRTGWFIESLLTELVIALVVRTWRPFYRSRPGKLLLKLTLLLCAVTLALPYLPFIGLLGFVPLTPTIMLAVLAITSAYVLAAELLKEFFFRRLAIY